MILVAINPNDHIGLAWKLSAWAAKTHGGESEDWLGCVWSAIANAARTFDPSKGFKFSTLAWRSAQLKVLEESRRVVGRNGRTGVGLPVGPITDKLQIPARSQNKPADFDLDELRLYLDERERFILDGLARGISMKEIGKELGVSRARVHQIVNVIRTIAKNLKD